MHGEQVLIQNVAYLKVLIPAPHVQTVKSYKPGD
jgi:hypothetical protein